MINYHLLEFLHHPIGISSPPHWNFFTTPLEFLHHPIGISSPPISLKSLDFTGFLTHRNQVSNQVNNQVSNQAINQGERASL